MNLNSFLKITSIFFMFASVTSNAEIIINNNLNKTESTLINTIGILNGSRIININRNNVILNDKKEDNFDYKKEKNVEIKKYNINYTEQVKETPKVIQN